MEDPVVITLFDGHDHRYRVRQGEKEQTEQTEPDTGSKSTVRGCWTIPPPPRKYSEPLVRSGPVWP